MSFMPFYIIKISPYKPHETMLWIGMIMGLNSFIAAAAAPIWGSLTSKFRHKSLFQSAFLFNGMIFILMGYTATALIGNYVISYLTPRAKLKGVIAALCLTSAFLQILLFFSGGVIGFAAIRMLQTGVIAAVIPLVMAGFVSELGGTGIGFLNSARFAGNGIGPLMATSVVAGSNLLTRYLLIAVLTIGSVLAFLITGKKKSG